VSLQHPNTGIGDDAANLADAAKQATDEVIRASQRVAHNTANHLAETIDDARTSADRALDRISTEGERLVRRGVDAVKDRSQQLREQALRASDTTVGYVKDEPLKALLIAAAVGAALMALLTIGSRTGTRD
jgi:ElaB/YqjD/DUF883 family membrane-anchored ribosome-binding protein